MIKKHLFKTVKTLTAATLIALGVMAGSNISTPVNTPSTVTAYAMEHQSYTDSTGYSLRLDGDTWHCYNSNGQIDYNYDGLALNDFGWWKVSNGTVDFSFTGLALNQYGWWYVNNGSIDFTYTGMAENEYGWWYVTNGAVDFSFTGLAENQYGWWYLTNGAVNFEYNGMAENEYGWWRVAHGAVDMQYTGMAANKYGEWYFIDGHIAFDFNGELVANFGEGWKHWNIENGFVVGSQPATENTTGYKLKNIDGTWKYVVDGQVDYSYTGMAENSYGWWYVKDGVIDTDFAGVAQKEDGTMWLFSGGYWGAYEEGEDVKELYECKLNTHYTGIILWNGVTYDINRGLATISENDISQTYNEHPEMSALDSTVNTNEYWKLNPDGTADGWYTLEQDGIVYYFNTGDGNMTSGKYDKATNSIINNTRWIG